MGGAGSLRNLLTFYYFEIFIKEGITLLYYLINFNKNGDMKGIYKITNLINEKVYIGQTDRINERKREHFYNLEKNKHHNEHLQKAFKKYGINNFVFEILEETEFLDERELYWINKYGGINSDNNYNLKDPLDKKWSDYVKVKQSKCMMGENNPNYGNKWTEEQKQKISKERIGKTLEERIGVEKAQLAKEKMSKSQKGRKHPEEVKKKIGMANSGEKNPAYGKGYRQVGNKNPMWGKPNKNRKPIIQLTLDGKFVREFEYLSEVKEYGFNIGNVCNCANGVKGYKQSKGFHWRWKE